ncbi:YfiT family bacillithiol transferase [Fictibacillus gelatini]|uniref:YfiT family bacillithiol transferase n=1 Tax=Fictibacillus gelatini TaxID=225985 RepID=UPI0003F6C201|nr:bacillithiol transferase BstA [Fictibacillus gelatini]
MDLRYPVGQFIFDSHISPELIEGWIKEIENAPIQLKEAVQDLNDEQLDTPYRSGGWTVRQVVHHLADSHMNSFIRFKLAITENNPTIKPYREDKWAELPDSNLPITISLVFLEALHKRWVALLRSLNASDFEKTFNHPELGDQSIATAIGLYAWHGRHHIAHISSLRERSGW